MIFPTKPQELVIKRYMYLVRKLYNLCIEIEEECYENYLAGTGNGLRIYYESELLGIIKSIIRSDNINSDISELPSHILSLTVSHAMEAYENFFNENIRHGHPRFKTNHFYCMRFSVRNDNCYITNAMLKIEGFSHGDLIDVKTHKYDGLGRSSKGFVSDKEILLYQPTISYDGDYFYFSFSYFKPKIRLSGLKTDVIGIDLGSRNTFTLSTGEIYHQPRCLKEKRMISKLDRVIRNLETPGHDPTLKNVNRLKLERQRRQKYRDIHNKRFYFYHDVTTNIVRRNPTAICIEKIGVSNMIYNNPYLSDIISDTYYFNIRKMFEYKSNKYGILLIEAKETYPSSKICSECGFKYTRIGSKHTFKCPVCGNVIDRDLNAALNLKDLYNQYMNNNFTNISFDWLNGIKF